MKTAYLAINGDDATAQLDDPDHPFKTMAAALVALKPFAPNTSIKDLGYIKPKTP